MHASHRAGKEKASSSELWHRRLGHPAHNVLSSLPVIDNAALDFGHTKSCDVCFLSKKRREAFHESFNKAVEPFALVHCDVWGPYCTPSSCCAVYFLTIVDDYFRTAWIHLMLEISEVPLLLQNFCAMAARQFGHSVKTFWTDNGTEFFKLKPFFMNRRYLTSNIFS